MVGSVVGTKVLDLRQSALRHIHDRVLFLAFVLTGRCSAWRWHRRHVCVLYALSRSGNICSAAALRSPARHGITFRDPSYVLSCNCTSADRVRAMSRAGQLLEPDDVTFAVLMRGYGDSDPPQWAAISALLGVMQSRYQMKPSTGAAAHSEGLDRTRHAAPASMRAAVK